MRRRALEVGQALGPEALRPCPPRDADQSPEERTAILDVWIAERDIWTDARERYEELYGWEGGTPARVTEENDAHPIPDYPFDPLSV